MFIKSALQYYNIMPALLLQSPAEGEESGHEMILSISFELSCVKNESVNPLHPIAPMGINVFLWTYGR